MKKADFALLVTAAVLVTSSIVSAENKDEKSVTLTCHKECKGGCSQSWDNSACKICKNVKVITGSVTNCQLDCPAGVTLKNNSNLCVPCAAGSYKRGPGNHECYMCPEGTYSASSSAMCYGCPFGYFNDQGGKSSCKVCAPGTYSGKEGSSLCRNCPLGTYSTTAGSASCKKCSGVTSSNRDDFTRNSCVLKSRTVTAELTGYANTNFGDWPSSWDMCPAGEFVNRFQVRMDPVVEGRDNTALNAITMYCSNNTKQSQSDFTITSTVGQWGNWLAIKRCSGYFTAIDLRSIGYGILTMFSDDTGAEEVSLYCPTENKWVYGSGSKIGKWGGVKKCPKGSAICGLMTQVEAYQGKTKDDTALNNFAVRCCKLPESD